MGGGIGAGAFGTVRRARCRKTGREVAIKIIPKTKQTEESIRNECNVLRRASMHKCIASLEALYETETAFFMVMELATGGELFDKLVDDGPFSEREAALLVQELGGAIALLHAQGVCHADIKPENLLLTSEGHAKLVDFGFSSKYQDEDGFRTSGTREYMAPEVLKKEPGCFGPPLDMWALGCVLYVILAAEHPFDEGGELSADDVKFERNVLRQEANLKILPVSPMAKQVVGALLRKDPRERLTIEQLLQHPWLSEAAPPTGSLVNPTARAREAELLAFRKNSAQLRAACFAVMLQQQAAEHADSKDEITGADDFVKPRAMRRPSNGSKLVRHNSVRAHMVADDMLSRAFQAFDLDGKGFITQADLQRVLHHFGRRVESQQELHGILEAAAGFDREQRRVTYGNYVRMMGQTVKSSLDRGGVIFRRGDPVTHFYCLLSGEVEMVATAPDGSEKVIERLTAGDFFGENSLLAGRATRSATMRALTTVELLKLSKADFEAGFLGGGGGGRVRGRKDAAADEVALREKLLSFIMMVSRTKRVKMLEGEPIFKEGDAVDHFYVLSEGRLAVAGQAGGAARQDNHPFGRIEAGEGFGEMSLLAGKTSRSKTITCATPTCEVISVLGRDFLRLVTKSSVVKESFDMLSRQRAEHNTAVQAERATTSAE